MMTIADAGSYILKSQYQYFATSMQCRVQYAIHSFSTNMQCNYANYLSVSRIYVSSLVLPHDIMTVWQWCSITTRRILLLQPSSSCFSLQIYIFAECFHEKCDEKKKILINIIIEHWEPTLHIWRYGWRGHPREQDESKVQETIWNS